MKAKVGDIGIGIEKSYRKTLNYNPIKYYYRKSIGEQILHLNSAILNRADRMLLKKTALDSKILIELYKE